MIYGIVKRILKIESLRNVKVGGILRRSGYLFYFFSSILILAQNIYNVLEIQLYVHPCALTPASGDKEQTTYIDYHRFKKIKANKER